MPLLITHQFWTITICIVLYNICILYIIHDIARVQQTKIRNYRWNFIFRQMHKSTIVIRFKTKSQNIFLIIRIYRKYFNWLNLYNNNIYL